jgi:Family of unknown function (DUF6644)
MEFMEWLEGSALGHVMRDSGVWFYGIVNLAHILGVATLFGSVVILDLRLLGLWQDVPLAAITRPTSRTAGMGFGIAAITGAGMLATKATEYVGNPFLYIKFPAIGLALLNVFLVHRSSAWRAHRNRDLSSAERRRLAAMGGTSLLLWLTSISAGRMIGYW